MRCLLRSARQRFASAALVASLAAGLSKYRPSLAVAAGRLALLEEIRLGLERPDAGVHTSLLTYTAHFQLRVHALNSLHKHRAKAVSLCVCGPLRYGMARVSFGIVYE